jgi:hypothetical protein
VGILLHRLAVDGLLNLGVGFTVTVTGKVSPAQLPEMGVTVYVTVWAVAVLFVRVCEIFA